MMTAKQAARFQRGSGAYTCRCCQRLTRATGRGDNEHVGLCSQCYDLSGEENSLSDTGELYAPHTEVLGYFEQLRKAGVSTPERLFPTVHAACLACAN